MKPRILLAVIASMSATAVAAQSTPDPDSIPRDLVQALLQPTMGASGGGVQFSVGHVPPDLAPFFYVPKGARILGGMTSSSGTTVVISVPGTYDQIRTMYQTEMPKLGWAAPAPFGSMQRGGFVNANPTVSLSGNGLEFCHAGQTISIIPVSDGLGGMLVTGMVSSSGGRCSMAISRPAALPSSYIELPTMMNPPGVTPANATCFSASQQQMQVGFNGTAERVRTTMTPLQLIDHFTKGLTDSGWKSDGPATMARGVWTRPDTGKLVRELTMTVTPQAGLPCSEIQVTLRQYVGR
jgi:hypothetical protein